MKTITSIQELKGILQAERAQGKTVGLVPTMGYLHEGHLSLIRRAAEENQVVVVSVFVNPTQFGVNEDFDVYPRNLKRDQELSAGAGATYLFHPDNQEMYPTGYNTFVEVSKITEVLCGASRPGHFKGVTTVVCKLFNLVAPQRAYFGLKDAQQVVVIQRMVKDLNMDVQIVPCPIVREADGLAMSSRNVNLSETDRQAALVLSRSLATAREMIQAGETRAEQVRNRILAMLAEESLAVVDYVEIVDFENLKRLTELKGKILVALAVRVGKVRLIDNILLEA